MVINVHSIISTIVREDFQGIYNPLIMHLMCVCMCVYIYLYICIMITETKNNNSSDNHDSNNSAAHYIHII